MIIRSEQMKVFEEKAEENFARKLAAHLRENYAEAVVRQPENESTVGQLPEEDLLELVRVSIARARRHGLTFESSISAFSAVMFEAAPNFDKHSISKLCLEDKNIEPNERLDEALKILTEEHWEKIRIDYDVNAWQESFGEEAESTADEVVSESPDLAATMLNAESPAHPPTPTDTGPTDLEATVMNVENVPRTKEPTDIDEISFEETIVDFEKPEMPAEPVNLDDINFDETVAKFEDLEKAKKASKLPNEEDFDLDETIMNIKPEKE